jgi:hypothetical protein
MKLSHSVCAIEQEVEAIKKPEPTTVNTGSTLWYHPWFGAF